MESSQVFAVRLLSADVAWASTFPRVGTAARRRSNRRRASQRSPITAARERAEHAPSFDQTRARNRRGSSSADVRTRYRSGSRASFVCLDRNGAERPREAAAARFGAGSSSNRSVSSKWRSVLSPMAYPRRGGPWTNVSMPLHRLGIPRPAEVIEIGTGVSDIACGDRVACAGAQYSFHADVIRVPRNSGLANPSGRGLGRDAATITLGAIALQGVRRAEPTIGETFAVIGLGVLGQLTVQMLRASGCRTLGAGSRIHHAWQRGWRREWTQR